MKKLFAAVAAVAAVAVAAVPAAALLAAAAPAVPAAAAVKIHIIFSFQNSEMAILLCLSAPLFVK